MMKETFQLIKADLQELKKELVQMKDLVEQLQEAIPAVNEGDRTVEEVWAAIEPYRTTEMPSVEGYEKARAAYNEARKVHDEYGARIRELHDLIEAYEAHAESLGIPRSATEKLREWSNEISIAFGRYEGVLQYCAATAVVFDDIISTHRKDIVN